MNQPLPLNARQKALLTFIRRTPLSRGRSRRLILNYIKKRIKHPIITDFRGVPFILDLDNTTEAKALFGRYNLAELDFMKEKTARPGAVFVDLGANSGFYTQNFLAAQGQGRFALAIEPNPAMCARISRNYDLLQKQSPGTDCRLAIECCAVGDRSGETLLDLSQGLGCASVVAEKTAQTIAVKMEKFASLLQRHAIEKIDLLKADIEGHEDKALIPFFLEADPALFPRHIIIEHTSGDQWQGDLHGILSEKGYSAAGKTRGNLLLSRRV